MPLFLTVHHAPGLAPDEITQNTPDVLVSKYATFKHIFVDMTEGFIVTLYEATTAKELERELERVGFPFTSMNEISFEATADQLRDMLAGKGAAHGA